MTSTGGASYRAPRSSERHSSSADDDVTSSLYIRFSALYSMTSFGDEGDVTLRRKFRSVLYAVVERQCGQDLRRLLSQLTGDTDYNVAAIITLVGVCISWCASDAMSVASIG